MGWRPIVTDPETRARIRAILVDIVEGLPRANVGTDPDEPVDHALVRTYLASDDVVPDEDGAAAAALGEAIQRVRRTQLPGLFGGVARIGWAIAHLADTETADEACAAVDTALARVLLDWTGDYDLISGVVGFGVYALERGPAGLGLADTVLAWLERRAVPRGGGLTWFTGPELLVASQRALAPDGYWNLGLSHGAPGAIALLARYVANGVHADRAGALLERAVASLLAAETGPNEGGRYRAWHAEGGAARGESPSPRLAWCYGDLGVAATLVGAGVCAARPAWRDEGLALATACAARTREEAAIRDAALCHGALGISHLFNRIAQATGDAQLAAAARRWLDEGLAMHAPGAGIAGWPAVWIDDGVRRELTDATMLSGAAGVALALHAAVSEIEPSWDRLLLVDLPPH